MFWQMVSMVSKVAILTRGGRCAALGDVWCIWGEGSKWAVCLVDTLIGQLLGDQCSGPLCCTAARERFFTTLVLNFGGKQRWGNADAPVGCALVARPSIPGSFRSKGKQPQTGHPKRWRMNKVWSTAWILYLFACPAISGCLQSVRGLQFLLICHKEDSGLVFLEALPFCWCGSEFSFHI